MPHLQQLRAVGLALPWGAQLLNEVMATRADLHIECDVFTASELDGVHALLACLPRCSARFFHVAGRLDLQGVAAISQSLASGGVVITNLNLSFCALHDAAAEILAAGLKGSAVRSLAMRANTFGDAGGVAIVNACREIVSLSLSSNALGFQTAAALGAMLPQTSLAYLDLSHNNLCAESAVVLSAGISRSTLLRSINLSFNRLTPRGAVALASAIGDGAPLLNFLELEWTGAGGVGAVSLAHHLLRRRRPIHRLGLGSCQITRNGAMALAEALGGGLSLITLVLTNNPIADDGLAAIASSFATSSALARLEVSNCNFREQGAIALARCLASSNCHVASIDASGNAIGGRAVNLLLRALCDNTTLTELAIAVPPINGVGPDVECLLQRENARGTWTGTPNWARIPS